MSIQLGGTIYLGPTSGSKVDFSDNISQMTVNFQRETVTVPPTFGLPRASESAGPEKATVTIEFFSTQAAAAVWHELYDAIKTDSAELYFEGIYNDAAVGADNERWSGTLVVTDLDLAPVAVGSLRMQSKSYPVTAAGVTRATV